MFAFLAAALVILLWNFGGVLPHVWLFLYIAWTVALTALVVRDAWHGRLDLATIVTVGAPLALGPVGGWKLGASLAAFGWARRASRADGSGSLRFMSFLLLLGLLEAILGLLQHFIVPGWILGYHNANPDPSGSLINRNHFAGFLEMIVPISLGLAYVGLRGHRDLARSYLHLFIGALIALALVFSLSRAGILSFLVTLIVLATLMGAQRSRRSLGAALSLGLICLVLAGGAWIGIDVVLQRYSASFADDAVQSLRIPVAGDTLRMIRANPFGTGINSYRDVFRRYQTSRTDLLFDHAHNDYLETVAEWGLPVAVTFWCFVIFILVRSARAFVTTQRPDAQGIQLACFGALFSILFHSLFDFNLQIPSNAVLFFALLGIAWTGSDPPRSWLSSSSTRRTAGGQGSVSQS